MASRVGTWWQKSRFNSWWQKIQQHPFVMMGIIVLLIALIVLIVAVVLSNGTGFNEYTVKSTATETTLTPQTKVTTTVQSQPGKTLWDLLQLLIIPFVLAAGGLLFTRAQQLRDQEIAKIQHDRDQQLADQRAESERKAAERQAELERELTRDNQRE